MEIFRLATRNENQRTNGPVNAHRGSGHPPPPESEKFTSATIFYHFGWTPSRKNVWIRKQGHPRVIILSNYDGLESSMLHTDFRENRPAGSGEEDF